jgi:AraC family transcriptional regulator
MASWLHKGQYSGKITEQKTADGLLAGITSYSTDGCNPDFHCHENPHLILLLNGGNVYNTRRKSAEKMAGDMLFYHSGEIHQTLPGTAFSKCINLEVEQTFLANYHVSEQMLQQAAGAGANAKFLVLKMYKELLVNDALTHTSLQLLFLGLVGNTQKEMPPKPIWLAQVEALLHDEWDTVPSLETLSKAAGVHPVTISKYFTKYMGCTLGEYLRKIKVEKSMDFIRGGQDSLTEVATKCGFADQSHFIRNFKTYTGLLPKEFQAL